MGAQPSKPTLHEKAVFECLHNLQMQDDEEFIEISNNAEKPPLEPLIRDAQGLSIDVLESWQASVLKDPKNK